MITPHFRCNLHTLHLVTLVAVLAPYTCNAALFRSITVPPPDIDLNHNVFFLFANTTPTYDLPGALVTCGLEAAGWKAAQANQKVTVLATYPEKWRELAESGFAQLPVKFEYLDGAKILQDTPMEKWYTSGTWLKHESPYQDLVNAVKLAVVYKRGGMYLDSDIIVTNRRLFSMASFLAKQDDSTVSPHIFRFPARHPFLWLWMQHWVEACTPAHPHGQCGTGVIHPLYLERCLESNWPNVCTQLLEAKLTTPFPWENIAGVITPKTADTYTSSRNVSLAVHWYQTPLIKWSGQTCILETSYLDAVMVDTCPMTLYNYYDLLICKDYRLRTPPASMKEMFAYRDRFVNPRDMPRFGSFPS